MTDTESSSSTSVVNRCYANDPNDTDNDDEELSAKKHRGASSRIEGL